MDFRQLLRHQIFKLKNPRALGANDAQLPLPNDLQLAPSHVRHPSVASRSSVSHEANPLAEIRRPLKWHTQFPSFRLTVAQALLKYLGWE
jgi:hypothetical protein